MTTKEDCLQSCFDNDSCLAFEFEIESKKCAILKQWATYDDEQKKEQAVFRPQNEANHAGFWSGLKENSIFLLNKNHDLLLSDDLKGDIDGTAQWNWYNEAPWNYQLSDDSNLTLDICKNYCKNNSWCFAYQFKNNNCALVHSLSFPYEEKTIERDYNKAYDFNEFYFKKPLVNQVYGAIAIEDLGYADLKTAYEECIGNSQCVAVAFRRDKNNKYFLHWCTQAHANNEEDCVTVAHNEIDTHKIKSRTNYSLSAWAGIKYIQQEEVDTMSYTLEGGKNSTSTGTSTYNGISYLISNENTTDISPLFLYSDVNSVSKYVLSFKAQLLNCVGNDQNCYLEARLNIGSNSNDQMRVARNRHNEVLKFYIRKTTYHFSKEFYVPKLCGENSDQSCSNEARLDKYFISFHYKSGEAPDGFNVASVDSNLEYKLNLSEIKFKKLKNPQNTSLIKNKKRFHKTIKQ